MITYKQFISVIIEDYSSNTIEVNSKKLEKALRKEIDDDAFIKKFIEELKTSSLKEEVSDEIKAAVIKISVIVITKLWKELSSGVKKLIKGDALSKLIKFRLIAIATFFMLALGLGLTIIIEFLHDKNVDKSKVKEELVNASNKVKSLTKIK